MSSQNLSPQSSSVTALDNIRIVLVNTSHPGNIGAVARAMKNMCLSQLYLVDSSLLVPALVSARCPGRY